MIQTHNGVFFFSEEEVRSILVKAILKEHSLDNLSIESVKILTVTHDKC